MKLIRNRKMLQAKRRRYSHLMESLLGIEYLKDVLKDGFTEELCIAIHRLDLAWSAIAWEHENAVMRLQSHDGDTPIQYARDMGGYLAGPIPEPEE